LKKGETLPLEFTVKEKEYFVLGDNVKNSADSRFFLGNPLYTNGCIKKENIIGEVFYEFFLKTEK